MCAGLTLSLTAVDERLIAQRGLADRIVKQDDGSLALRFLFRDREALLPVNLDGLTTIVLWGNRDKRDSKLPHTGWCRVESLSEGKWNWLHPKEVEIPAERGLEKGVWFSVPGHAIRGVLVEDTAGARHAYMLTQAATEKYRQMTGHDREPVFVGGVI